MRMSFRRSIVFVILALLSGVNAFGLISRTVEKRFPLTEAGRASLSVSVFHGSLSIETADVPEIRVKVMEYFETTKEEEADRIVKNLILGMDFQQTHLKVSAEYTRDAHWSFEAWPPVKLAFFITVPKTCDLDLEDRDGGISVAEISGVVKAKTYSGAIYFKGVTGRAEARSDYGDIVVSHCAGDLKLHSVSGSFRVGPVTGLADVYGYGGEIEVVSAGGEVKAETSGADLTVAFRHPIKAPATLKTGGANIVLTLDKRSDCSLNLRASIFGACESLKNQLPLTPTSGSLGKSRLQAKLNQGGPLIEARASGGYIYLQAAPDA